MEEKKDKNKKQNYIWLISICIILLLTLPFHYLPDKLMMFPKDNLTFSNTFVFQEDINKIIERYNNASFLEKQAIKQEPLHRKLMEKGIIVEENSQQNFDDILKATELDFLKEYKDKYPYEVKLFENTTFHDRLKKLLGDRCEFLVEHFEVQIPIEITDNVFISTALQAHKGGETEFIIVYNFTSDVLSVGIEEEYDIKTYSENGEIPEQINSWAKNLENIVDENKKSEQPPSVQF